MITACLIGDQQLLDRLQTLPDVINSGLARNITQLGLDLQRAARGDQAPRHSVRRRSSSADLRVEQSGTTITARICLDPQNALRKDGVTGTTNVRASVRRNREVFHSPTAPKPAGALAGDGVPGPVESSFLRSALDNMTSGVRDQIDASLAEAVSQ